MCTQSCVIKKLKGMTDWHVHRAINNLASSQLLSTAFGREKYGLIVENVILIMQCWAKRWFGNVSWQTFLNRKSFLHEVEEAIVPLLGLVEYAQKNTQLKKVVVIDLCCGKGFFAMLLSYLANYYPDLREMVARIVCIEKNTNVKWNHLEAANLDCNSYIQLTRDNDDKTIIYACIPIEIWENTNIHSEAFEYKLLNYQLPPDSAVKSTDISGDSSKSGIDEIEQKRQIQRLAPEQTEVFLIGIHLCRRLSSRFIELCNILKNSVTAASLVGSMLAPCCLPRFGGSIYIRKRLNRTNYELYQSYSKDNMTWNKDMCWKCGSLEHVKADCVATADEILATKKKRKLNQMKRLSGEGNPGPPDDYASVPDNYAVVDMQQAQLSKQPFEFWCNYLYSSIECGVCGASTSKDSGTLANGCEEINTRKYESSIIEADLVNTHLALPSKEEQEDGAAVGDITVDVSDVSITNNWNFHRKTTWILCFKKKL